MKTTTNYGFKKPESNDPYNINDFNGNFDIIDTELKAASGKADTVATHIANVSNPHKTTAAQVGLGNVPNVSTNDQTPTYTVATANTALSSGEKLSVAMGKIAKAVNSLISHLADAVGHITAAERTKWNAKADQSSLANYLPLSGGTMTGVLIVPIWARIKASLTKGTAPTSSLYTGVGIYDAAGTGSQNLLGYMQTSVDPDGTVITKLSAFKYESGSTANVGVSCVYKGDGTYYVEVPTPATSDNSTKVATTAFVKNQNYAAASHTHDYLPVTGGTVKGANVTNLQLENTSSETSCVGFKGSTGHLGYLGMRGTKPVYISTDNVVNNLLHSGISVPVVISETAPTDTTALWIW